MDLNKFYGATLIWSIYMFQPTMQVLAMAWNLWLLDQRSIHKCVVLYAKELESILLCLSSSSRLYVSPWVQVKLQSVCFSLAIDLPWFFFGL